MFTVQSAYRKTGRCTGCNQLIIYIIIKYRSSNSQPGLLFFCTVSEYRSHSIPLVAE